MADLLIDGEWVSPIEGGTREIRSPHDNELVGVVDEATAADTVRAIEAARRAFDDGRWAMYAGPERGKLLNRAADLMERDLQGMGEAESKDTGKKIADGIADIVEVIRAFRYYAGLAGADAGRVVDTGDPNSISRVDYEPVGVCGLITPWNFPLLQASWKVAPALAAGNTFVIKPSELTPHSTIWMMKALVEAGLPAGVGNLVLGAGAAAGAPLASHPDVDMVSFTGGLITGRAIMAAAAATVKKVALELGGKNPNIVFADADFETAVDHAVNAVFSHSGQVCSAGARLIVEESLHDRLVDEIVRRAELIRLGGPFDPKAETGALISQQHRAKVQKYVDDAVAEGAILRCGGGPPSDLALAKGWYFAPTVLDGCTTTMGCVQDESFGPVLTVETFSDEDDAVRLGNDTIYGLAGAVFTSDGGKAQRVARRLRHGTIWINDYHPYAPQAEWGGFKQSGFGRELGPTGLHEYLEPKHIWQNINPGPTHWFAADSAAE